MKNINNIYLITGMERVRSTKQCSNGTMFLNALIRTSVAAVTLQTFFPAYKGTTLTRKKS